MEHRWGQRVGIDLPIRIKGTAFGRIGARLSDLSLSGAFIEVDLDVRILCPIKVATIVPHFLAPNTESLDAHVIRRDHRGIGIEWAAFTPATYRLLLTLASRWQDAQRKLADSRLLWVDVARREEVAATPGITEGCRPPRRVRHSSTESIDEHATL